MFKLKSINNWIGKELDLNSESDWEDLIAEFGSELLYFLIDDKYVGDIPVIPAAQKLKNHFKDVPHKSFATYPGAVWVLMAHKEVNGQGLPPPFAKEGFLLPLEWRKPKSADDLQRAQACLPRELLDLAAKVKAQFKAAQVNAADEYELFPWNGFQGEEGQWLVDFRMKDDDAHFDSAWGALATGLYGVVGKHSGCRAADTAFCNWPFSSVAFRFEEDVNSPDSVTHLEDKLSVVARFGGKEIAVALQQVEYLKGKVEDFNKKNGTAMEVFDWKWSSRDFLGSLRSLSRCNQPKRRKRIRLVFGACCVLCVMIASVISIREYCVAQAAIGRESFGIGQKYKNGWGVRVNYSIAATNFLRAAEKGHLEAMYEISLCYGKGLGTVRNAGEMVCWLKRAVKRGHLQSMSKLAECYQYGDGVERNIEEAMLLYRKASMLGDVFAGIRLNLDHKEVECALRKEICRWRERSQNKDLDAKIMLAMCYYSGIGVEKNLRKAVELYREVAEYGEPISMGMLGIAHLKGIGVEKNDAESVRWLQMAADKGNLPAMWLIGMFNKYGRCGVPKNEVKALRWLQLAASQGHTGAMCDLGDSYEKGIGVAKDYDKALELFRKAAEKGDKDGMFQLALCYRNGVGVEKSGGDEIKWLYAAAEKGSAQAMYNIGVCFAKGQIVNKDNAEAAKWYHVSATNGCEEAMYNLGFCYEYGKGVDKDVREAVKWYRKAAEKGYANAMFNLGVCYEKGKGVETNACEAVKWYLNAAEKGYEAAMFNLGNCYYKGEGVQSNACESVKWWRKAADKGVPAAMCNLGHCYYTVRRPRFARECSWT